MKSIYWAADSTVQYNSILTYPQTGMGQVLHLFLKPDVKVRNHAVNGRSTKSFIDEGRLEDIRTEIEMSAELGKRIVTVYELQPGLLSQTNNSVTYYKDGLGAIKTSYDKMLSAYEGNKLGIAYHTLNYLKVLQKKKLK